MSKSLMISDGEVITLHSRWTVGAAGAHTKVFGPGVASVARTADGKYTMTFNDVPYGPIVSATMTHWAQVDAEPFNCGPKEGGYTASAKTLLFESWVIDDTAAQTEIPSGDEVSYTVVFAKTT